MKKVLLAVAVLGFASAAFADPTYSGSVTGTGSITTTGTAVAGSYVNGSGFSAEHADMDSYGHSTVGGSVNAAGSTVSTDTYASTTTHASGLVGGEQPGIEGNTIFNGAISFGSTSVGATGTSAFTTSGVSPVSPVDGDDHPNNGHSH